VQVTSILFLVRTVAGTIAGTVATGKNTIKTAKIVPNGYIGF